MRKYLLAGTAALVIVATGGDLAFAQTQTQGLPPNVMQGIPATALPVQAANNANNTAPAAQPNGIANPTPGSIVVHLNARVLFAPVAAWSSLDVVRPTPTAAPNKVSNFANVGYMRIYPGMDAVAANGLRYGGSIELRQNFGPTSGSTANSNGSANTFSSTVFVRRAFVYLATDKLGIVRFGQGDGVLGLFDYGVTTFQNFDTGGWDGDFQGTVPGNANLTFPFPALQGAEYGSSKLVYLSPRLAGFDFGFAYAPNSGALQDGSTTNSLTSTASTLTTCAVAASGCATLSTSNVALDGARFRDLIETGVRYRGNIGAVGIYGFGVYTASGHVNVSPPVAGSQFNGLSFGDFGLAATYGGLTLGGHVMAGKFNGVMALQPKGGVAANAWLIGAQYTTGPLTAGLSYYVYQSQGSPLTVGIGQRVERGLAVGGNYTLAPGLSLYASYLYGTRHQGGFNFATGAVGAANNDVKTQLIAVGTAVKW
jgi:predicted porin